MVRTPGDDPFLPEEDWLGCLPRLALFGALLGLLGWLLLAPGGPPPIVQETIGLPVTPRTYPAARRELLRDAEALMARLPPDGQGTAQQQRDRARLRAFIDGMDAE
jgi:hypothetical protein